MDKYLVNIYVAAPGTRLKDPVGATSLPGHMYYGIEHAGEKLSFGLAPIGHGQVDGPGKVYKNDVDNYQSPFYVRTIEITEQQYRQLKEFGDNPIRYGFNTYYQDVRNNCVDFTWAALNHAGLHARTTQHARRGSPQKFIPRQKYEGSLKPTNNVSDIKTIRDPIPSSSSNKETNNPMPSRTALQWLLSERRPADGIASGGRAMT
jgi:hypothetical protein